MFLKPAVKNFTMSFVTGTSCQMRDFETQDTAQQYADAVEKNGAKYAILRNSDRVVVAQSENTTALVAPRF